MAQKSDGWYDLSALVKKKLFFPSSVWENPQFHSNLFAISGKVEDRFRFLSPHSPKVVLYFKVKSLIFLLKGIGLPSFFYVPSDFFSEWLNRIQFHLQWSEFNCIIESF